MRFGSPFRARKSAASATTTVSPGAAATCRSRRPRGGRTWCAPGSAIARASSPSAKGRSASPAPRQPRLRLPRSWPRDHRDAASPVEFVDRRAVLMFCRLAMTVCRSGEPGLVRPSAWRGHVAQDGQLHIGPAGKVSVGYQSDGSSPQRCRPPTGAVTPRQVPHAAHLSAPPALSPGAGNEEEEPPRLSAKSAKCRDLRSKGSRAR